MTLRRCAACQTAINAFVIACPKCGHLLLTVDPDSFSTSPVSKIPQLPYKRKKALAAQSDDSSSAASPTELLIPPYDVSSMNASDGLGLGHRILFIASLFFLLSGVLDLLGYEVGFYCAMLSLIGIGTGTVLSLFAQPRELCLFLPKTMQRAAVAERCDQITTSLSLAMQLRRAAEIEQIAALPAATQQSSPHVQSANPTTGPIRPACNCN
jgi:hypothetical protein